MLKYFRRKSLKSIYNIDKKIGGNCLALEIGKFRLGGEIHQWMYDSFNLGRSLKIIGFKKNVVRDAFTSYLKDWKKYHLDTEPDGTIDLFNNIKDAMMMVCERKKSDGCQSGSF
jgi:hypothetical protein